MIYISSTASPQQPSSVCEQPERVKTDTYSMDGSVERNQSASKKCSKFVISMAKPETYRFYEALYEAAAPVTYRNDCSNVVGGVLEFTGIIDVEESDYIRGGSLMTELTVTVREQ